jgi:hypothetical protein
MKKRVQLAVLLTLGLGVAALSTLGIWVCARRSIAPRRARVQRLFGRQSCIGPF